MTGEVFVQLKNICKCYEGAQEVIKDLNLNVCKGEFLTLLGPSGCGKTTTLRMIAGFEEPTKGEILIDGEDVTNKSPHERCVNTVFQNYALFPHMNVFDNIAFGLKMKRVPKEEKKKRVQEMINMVQLQGFEDRMPSQLSGGQMQRVAIARAVINKPKVLLLDEPLGALDLKLRKQMQIELKHLQRQLGITFIFVTHDQEEALTMSDRIVVMNKGVIEQLGTPEEIYERPKSKFVATFLGETNILEGSVIKIKEKEVLLNLEEEKDIIRIPNLGYEIGEKFIVSVRPERIVLKSKPNEDDVYLKCKFKEQIYIGAQIKTVFNLANGKEIIVNQSVVNHQGLNQNDKSLYVTWRADDTVVIKE